MRVLEQSGGRRGSCPLFAADLTARQARLVNLLPLRERAVMKRGTNESNASGSGPEEADPFHATEALQAGEKLPLAHFVRDLAEAVVILAELFESRTGAGRQLQFLPRPPHTRVPKKVTVTAIEEWESTLPQLKDAIQLRSAAPIGWYLRDVGNVLGLLTVALDPPPGERGWRLEFRRQGRGRRPDPKKFQKNSAIVTELQFATWATGKQEAAIAEVQAKRGIRRPTIFRAKQKSNKARKSHKEP